MKTAWIVALGLLPAVAGAQDTGALDESRAVAKQFAQQLGGELKQALAAGGPENAVKVCKNIAPAIATELSTQHGWQVRRVSLKTRNPMIGMPDAWEQKVLAEFDQRAAKGEKADAMEYSEVVTEPQGKYFRYMKALGVQPLCLACHGKPENIAEGTRAKLQAEYPHDRATGYQEGQIRGAITIKRPL